MNTAHRHTHPTHPSHTNTTYHTCAHKLTPTHPHLELDDTEGILCTLILSDLVYFTSGAIHFPHSTTSVPASAQSTLTKPTPQEPAFERCTDIIHHDIMLYTALSLLNANTHSCTVIWNTYFKRFGRVQLYLHQWVVQGNTQSVMLPFLDHSLMKAAES